MTREELVQAEWRAVKDYAEDTLGYEKPEGSSWHDDEVIDGILALQGSKASEKEVSKDDAIASSFNNKKDKGELTMAKEFDSKTFVRKGKYCTKAFKRRGTPYCPLCGAANQNDFRTGKPVCAEGLEVGQCPRLEESNDKEGEKTTVDFMDL